MKIRKIAEALLQTHALAMTLFVSLSFVLGSALYPRLEALTGLRVAPEFSGGEVIAVFRDAFQDDTGEGAYVYPEHPRFQQEGILDILKYTLYEPQITPRWQNGGPFWQLGVTLAAMNEDSSAAAGFSGPLVMIKMSFPGRDLPDWEILIDGDHRQARFYLNRGREGEVLREIPLIAVPEQRTLYVRIPLNTPETEFLLGGVTVRHAVAAAVYDPYAEGERQPVKRSASLSSGGGAERRGSSRLWDILMPLGSPAGEKSQAQLLAEGESFSVTAPLPGRAYLGIGGLSRKQDDTGQQGLPQDDWAALEEALAEAEEKSLAEDRALLEDSDLSSLRRGALLFRLGRRAEAEKIFWEEGKTFPPEERPLALAYGGCLTAMKGGDSASPAEAMRLVHRGWEQLNQAVREAEALGDETLLWEVLLCRGSVAVSVPEAVFGYGEQGAADFEEAARLSARRGDGAGQADALVSAALAWELVKDNSRAELAWIKAASLKDLSPRAALECARRGFIMDP